jgi:hypothetical protein
MPNSGRVFPRGMTSETYGLKDFRTAQLAAPRVRGDSVVVDDLFKQLGSNQVAYLENAPEYGTGASA